jgi:asparagine synthase (glutamine-hydrolysing)
MCGITGFRQTRATSFEAVTARVRAMTDSLRHRGPDDDGFWTDPSAGIALGHRRLSIIDLSAAGHQPMVSADGRLVMIYNGEVYSHEEIRPGLVARGIRFRGHSDSEVILESFAADGVAATLPKLIGMFAIALWDRKERSLTLIRDRLGIKPMYWAWIDGLFLFGSELKALRAHPDWTPRINRNAVAAFLRHNYIPAPHTIYEGVHKLEPGTLLTLPLHDEPQITRYWNARQVVHTARANPLRGSDAEITDRLENLLTDAVKRRMIADVPLGAFLSGGVDSSTVVALMQKAGTGKVRSFTIGFDIPGFDEAPHAKAVADHLGTEHTEMTVTAQQALEIIPKLADWYDEPFADPSQIPTYLVSAMTRRHVTVALSGDGGDELFAGYNRYRLGAFQTMWLRALPQSLRRGLARAITMVPPERWSALLARLPARFGYSELGDKLHKLASVLSLGDTGDVYRRLVTHWEPSRAMPGAREPDGVLWDPKIAAEFPEPVAQMQFLDLVTYLPDDILTKVDRASMAVGLEARVPLLDHRVVEFAWQLPESTKIRAGRTKWALRQVLDRHVPRSIIERPKMGFGLPLAEWLRGPLRDWAETLLAERRLREHGLVDAAYVRRHWQEHLSGRRNWQYLIWDVLMLEAWHERWASPA